MVGCTKDRNCENAVIKVVLSQESIFGKHSKTVLRSTSNVNKPQRTFIAALLATLIVFQGKATYRNMNRYSGMSEKRFSRWYSRSFDFALFNRRIIAHALPENDRIAAIDASFISKSGKLT